MWVERPLLPAHGLNRLYSGINPITLKTTRIGLITRRCSALPSNRIRRRPAGELVGATRQVVDRLLANSVARPAANTAASGANDLPLLAEERDRRPGGTSAVRCALQEPADRT